MNKILVLIKQHKQISAAQIAEQLSVSNRTIERDIEKLRMSGMLKRIGSDKGGYWEVID
ncbi:HTH domain-containing protein [Parabacteroides sp. FAFU027]|uniref:HTH domain-containing protein n=1 Tax=Parabacteroides sp. FAFU027 TaxID=2922715 RepID=UPI001FAEA589|nr:HTH domain-containing protein [Parabacteroides sp. FAFU027]